MHKTDESIDLELNRGAFFEWDFQFLDGPLKTSPPLNLTGYTARMQVRSSVDSPTVDLDLSTANARLVITPLIGLVSIGVQVPTSNPPTAARGVYDLFLTSPAGKSFRAAFGAVRFNRNVTERA